MCSFSVASNHRLPWWCSRNKFRAYWCRWSHCLEACQSLYFLSCYWCAPLGLLQIYLLKDLCFLLVPLILQRQHSFTPLYLHMPSLTSNVATKERSLNSLNPFFSLSPSLEPPTPPLERIDTTPKKLEWKLSPEIRAGVRFAETRISDLICQNDCQALEFKGYGKNFITSHGFSPDAFIQMAFQAAYFGLYGMQVILKII
jgi:hypothetical protein